MRGLELEHSFRNQAFFSFLPRFEVWNSDCGNSRASVRKVSSTRPSGNRDLTQVSCLKIM